VTNTLSSDCSLAEARELVAREQENGIICPCCGRRVKVYKRRLYGAQVEVLMLMYDYFTSHEGWLHVPSYLNGRGVKARGGDWAKMKHWSLIVSSLEVRKDGSDRAGRWRITERGCQFVERQIAVPAYYLSDKNRVVGWADQQVYIDQIASKRFNYAELMRKIKHREPPSTHQWPPPGFE
jgi:hypothetical protein